MTPAEEVHALWEHATHETNYRTIASRAYYACFTRCMAYAIAHRFEPARTGEDHRRLPAFLRDRSNHPNAANLLHRIGALRLPKLKKLRTTADYDQTVRFTRADAAEAVQVLDEIIGYMDEIEGIG